MAFGPLSWFRRLNASRRRCAEALHHQEALRDFYGRFVHRDDLCYDVGANQGDRTEILLGLGARVVCVEPQPACIKRLRKRFRNHPRVIIVEAALGEAPGRGELAVCEREPTISTMSQRWRSEGRFAGGNEWTKTVPVAVTTLDRLISEHGIPAFCKIDVEGFELSVLKGLSIPIPIISFEFTREFFADAKACIERLRTIGPARFNASFGESSTFLWGQWVQPEELYERFAAEEDPLLWGDIYVKMLEEETA